MDRRLQEFKDQADSNCKDLATRLDRLETNRTTDPLEENESQANSRSRRRGQTQTHHIDTNAWHIKNVKVDASSFGGCLSPQAYIY